MSRVTKPLMSAQLAAEQARSEGLAAELATVLRQRDEARAENVRVQGVLRRTQQWLTHYKEIALGLRKPSELTERAAAFSDAAKLYCEIHGVNSVGKDELIAFARKQAPIRRSS